MWMPNGRTRHLSKSTEAVAFFLADAIQHAKPGMLEPDEINVVQPACIAYIVNNKWILWYRNKRRDTVERTEEESGCVVCRAFDFRCADKLEKWLEWIIKHRLEQTMCYTGACTNSAAYVPCRVSGAARQAGHGAIWTTIKRTRHPNIAWILLASLVKL